MTVLITLTSAGADTGNFDLYSDVDGYTTPFETGIPKYNLVSGYISTIVPLGTTIVRVKSNTAYDSTCTNYTNIQVVLTTSSSTTLPPDPATSTLSFTYSAGAFTFTLSNAIPSTDIRILSATVNGSTSSGACASNTFIQSDTLTDLVIIGGTTTSSARGISPMTCNVTDWKREDGILLLGRGTLYNGNVITIGSTTVTISIPSTCVSSYVCTPGDAIVISGGALLVDACGIGVVMFTQLGADIITGTIIYTNNTLTTPITGWNYVSDNAGQIYNIDSVTGVIGIYTGSNC